jgi:uncharacterized membrane protein
VGCERIQSQAGICVLHRKKRIVVAVTLETRYSALIHPFHAVLLAGTVVLFLSATLSDAAYASTYEIQWANFASWLIVGGLVLGAVAVVFAIVDLSRPVRRAAGLVFCALLLLAAWVVGFFNALMHARDAWGSMPGGLVLSIFATLLACVATWFGFATPRIGSAR